MCSRGAWNGVSLEIHCGQGRDASSRRQAARPLCAKGIPSPSAHLGRSISFAPSTTGLQLRFADTLQRHCMASQLLMVKTDVCTTDHPDFEYVPIVGVVPAYEHKTACFDLREIRRA